MFLLNDVIINLDTSYKKCHKLSSFF